MIKKYILKENLIEIVNSFNQSIIFSLPKEYISFEAVYQFEDFLIVVLGNNEITSDVMSRQNVWRINEKGGLDWMVEDHLDLFEEENTESLKRATFQLLYRFNEKWVLGGSHGDYWINLETGKLKFWKAERF